MNARQIALISFAELALKILQEDIEWDDDTVDDIGIAAIDLGLAKTGKDSLFEIIK